MPLTELPFAIEEYINSKRAAKPDKWPTHANWLSDAAKRAWQITLVTHAPKFTHGDAKGSGALVTPDTTPGSLFITTRSLNCPAIDVIGNAAALDVATLLLIKQGNSQLIDILQQGEWNPLRQFAQDDDQAEQWRIQFLDALTNKTPASHSLAKQLYFPVKEPDQQQYHLLSLLFPSSLAHALSERIDASRFSESAKAARQARRDGIYSADPVIEFVSLAEQHFGGTKPQNVSLLNSKRHGRTFLLSCLPPTWQSQAAYPDNDQVFWRQFAWQQKGLIRQLKQFLLQRVDKENNRHIRRQRAELVSELITQLHHHAARLRNAPSGWSHKRKLSAHLCQWLDPQSPYLSQTIDWQYLAGESFARWLNQQLSDEQLLMGDIELHVWRKQMTRQLRLLSNDLESL